MANVLILDDESITLNRLLNVLSINRQHQLWTSDSLAGGVRTFQQLGSTLDLLLVDVSLLQIDSSELLGHLVSHCPRARMLAVGPTFNDALNRDLAFLRKPFTDEDLVKAVERALTLLPAVATAQANTTRQPLRKSSCTNPRSIRARAASR